MIEVESHPLLGRSVSYRSGGAGVRLGQIVGVVSEIDQKPKIVIRDSTDQGKHVTIKPSQFWHVELINEG